MKTFLVVYLVHANTTDMAESPYRKTHVGVSSHGCFILKKMIHIGTSVALVVGASQKPFDQRDIASSATIYYLVYRELIFRYIRLAAVGNERAGRSFR